jgi:hypothetical protein
VPASTCPPYPSPLVDWVTEPKSVATLVFGETVVALGAGVRVTGQDACFDGGPPRLNGGG